MLQMDSARQNLFKLQQKIKKNNTLMLSNEFGFCSISSDGSDMLSDFVSLCLVFSMPIFVFSCPSVLSLVD